MPTAVSLPGTRMCPAGNPELWDKIFLKTQVISEAGVVHEGTGLPFLDTHHYKSHLALLATRQGSYHSVQIDCHLSYLRWLIIMLMLQDADAEYRAEAVMNMLIAVSIDPPTSF